MLGDQPLDPRPPTPLAATSGDLEHPHTAALDIAKGDDASAHAQPTDSRTPSRMVLPEGRAHLKRFSV
jgi:hypothetical protein